ncbi:MAG: LysE family translocator [Porticoccaceae bacterium]
MDITFLQQPSLLYWGSVTMACLLGAMSPGPSLAIVVNHSLSQGRVEGVCAALAHGLGIGIFAFLTAFGLVVAVDKNPLMFDVIQILGSLFLLYMAIKLLFAPLNKTTDIVVAIKSSPLRAARDGFLIALVNPKILIFFTALFSQFVHVDSEPWEKMVLTLIAGGVDALWYILVALLISQTGSLVAFQKNSWWLDKIFSLVLFSLAAYFILEITQSTDFAAISSWLF